MIISFKQKIILTKMTLSLKLIWTNKKALKKILNFPKLTKIVILKMILINSIILITQKK